MRSNGCIQAAKNNLANARRLLDSGDAVNWVSGHLGSALHWAMKGWLLAQGHTVSHGSGWRDTREAFLILGPDELRSQLITLYAQTVSLEFQLMGDKDTAPTLSSAEWRGNAWRIRSRPSTGYLPTSPISFGDRLGPESTTSPPTAT